MSLSCLVLGSVRSSFVRRFPFVCLHFRKQVVWRFLPLAVHSVFVRCPFLAGSSAPHPTEGPQFGRLARASRLADQSLGATDSVRGSRRCAIHQRSAPIVRHRPVSRRGFASCEGRGRTPPPVPA